MSAIFLSASVPIVGRGNFYEDADPFLIQSAVRELVTVALGRRLIVWGGHPAITPMVWAVCEDLGLAYANAVVLYQSKFFADMFPDENRQFGNVEYVDAVPDDREGSLLRMRQAMLSRRDLTTAVFIGGMEGISAEYGIFHQFHPEAQILPVSAPGGAARQLAKRLGFDDDPGGQIVDFATLFHTELNILPNMPRTSFG